MYRSMDKSKFSLSYEMFFCPMGFQFNRIHDIIFNGLDNIFADVGSIHISVFVLSANRLYTNNIKDIYVFTTSSKSVISLLPLTCHIPVIPGFIASRAR